MRNLRRLVIENLRRKHERKHNNFKFIREAKEDNTRYMSDVTRSGKKIPFSAALDYFMGEEDFWNNVVDWIEVDDEDEVDPRDYISVDDIESYLEDAPYEVVQAYCDHFDIPCDD